MSQARAAEAEDLLAVLAALPEHLATARRILKHLPDLPQAEDRVDAPVLLRLLDVVPQALQIVTAATQDLSLGQPTAIAVHHQGPRLQVVVQKTATATEIHAMVTALRRRDLRLMRAAELVGALLPLALRWLAAGFAPLVVVPTLVAQAPHLVALADALLADAEA